MRRTSLVVGCGLLVALAGFGDSSSGGRADAVSVRISVGPGGLGVGGRAQSFSLTCNPTGGTLPLAGRVCRAISRHPKAMLDPGPMLDGPCEASPVWVSIVTTVGGRPTPAAGTPGCFWPGSARLGVYASAADGHEGGLSLWERRLHCDEDPVFFAPGADPQDRYICLLDLIRTAERLRPLARIDPARIFPVNVGSRRCTIVAGGPSARKLPGTCSISAVGNPSFLLGPVTLTFVERWVDGNQPQSHTWRIKVGWPPSAKLLSESGARPPQLWR